MLKLSELAENYINSALHTFLTLKEKQEIVKAAQRNPSFLQLSLIDKKEAADRRVVAFMVLSAAREVVRDNPSN
ncbi:MAG: hypothetical protein JWO15_3570 [Sphingomonadales bacterium]|nr:hypothetical protein [Sphingomonadales bacterium]